MAVLVSLSRERVRRRPPLVTVGSRAYRITRPGLAHLVEWVVGPMPHERRPGARRGVHRTSYSGTGGQIH